MGAYARANPLEGKEESIARPTVTVSYAQTLDGRLATLDGGSHWISAPDSLCFSRELRAANAAMVGMGTVARRTTRASPSASRRARARSG